MAKKFIPGLDSIPDLDRIVKDFISHFKKKVLIVLSLFVLYSTAIFVAKLIVRA